MNNCTRAKGMRFEGDGGMFPRKILKFWVS